MNGVLPRPDGYRSRDEFRRWCEARPRGRYERVDCMFTAPRSEKVGGLPAGHSETWIVVNGPIAMDPPGIVVTVEEIYRETA